MSETPEKYPKQGPALDYPRVREPKRLPVGCFFVSFVMAVVVAGLCCVSFIGLIVEERWAWAIIFAAAVAAIITGGVAVTKRGMDLTVVMLIASWLCFCIIVELGCSGILS